MLCDDMINVYKFFVLSCSLKFGFWLIKLNGILPESPIAEQIPI